MVHRSRKVLFSLRRRSVRDAVTIAGLCLVTYIAAATFDVFGQTYEFIKRYEAYELDEAIVVAIVFGFLMAIYALRRVQDLKREIFKRRDAERKSANHAVRLTTAVNNMTQGLLMFDSADRLVVCNERADSSLKGNTISPHWKGWCDGRRLHTTDGCGAGEDR